MNKYEKMSDPEINTRVAEITGRVIQSPTAKGRQVVAVLSQKLDGLVDTFDPCNNPLDAWPIIVDNEISLVKDAMEDKWSARSGVDEFTYESMSYWIEFSHEKPLRAAMIVFLMMKDAE